MFNSIRKILADKSGATALEYVLIGSMIAVSIFTGLRNLHLIGR